MKLTAYDLYCYLNAALDVYMDSIALQEDPTEEERKHYDYIKFWRPSTPDEEVKKILESLVFTNKDDNESQK